LSITDTPELKFVIPQIKIQNGKDPKTPDDVNRAKRLCF